MNKKNFKSQRVFCKPSLFASLGIVRDFFDAHLARFDAVEISLKSKGKTIASTSFAYFDSTPSESKTA